MWKCSKFGKTLGKAFKLPQSKFTFFIKLNLINIKVSCTGINVSASSFILIILNKIKKKIKYTKNINIVKKIYTFDLQNYTIGSLILRNFQMRLHKILNNQNLYLFITPYKNKFNCSFY